MRPSHDGCLGNGKRRRLTAGGQRANRIHLGERDRWQGKPLYQAIVELLRGHHYAGATVYRGIVGFGASARLRTDRLEILSLDLPIVVECVDTEDRVEAIFPELDRMIGGGLITLEKVRVRLYRPHAGDRSVGSPPAPV